MNDAERESIEHAAILIKDLGAFDASKIKTITRNQLEFTKDDAHVIGRGAFGTILYAGSFEDKPVVIKFLRTEASLDGRTSVDFTHYRSAVLMQQLHVPWLVELIGVQIERIPKYVVLEALQCSLFSLLYGDVRFRINIDQSRGGSERDENDHRELTRMERLDIIYDIANALKHLHDGVGVEHGSINSHNILLPASGQVKLSDFGFSHREGNKGGLMDFTSVDDSAKKEVEKLAVYHSPEIRKELVRSSKQGDVYAFSVLANEVLSNTFPVLDLTDWESVSSSTQKAVFMKDPSTKRSHLPSKILSVYSARPKLFTRLINVEQRGSLAAVDRVCAMRGAKGSTEEPDVAQHEDVFSEELGRLLVKSWDEDPVLRPTSNAIVSSLQILYAELTSAAEIERAEAEARARGDEGEKAKRAAEEAAKKAKEVPAPSEQERAIRRPTEGYKHVKDIIVALYAVFQLRALHSKQLLANLLSDAASACNDSIEEMRCFLGIDDNGLMEPINTESGEGDVFALAARTSQANNRRVRGSGSSLGEDPLVLDTSRRLNASAMTHLAKGPAAAAAAATTSGAARGEVVSCQPSLDNVNSRTSSRRTGSISSCNLLVSLLSRYGFLDRNVAKEGFRLITALTQGEKEDIVVFTTQKRTISSPKKRNRAFDFQNNNEGQYARGADVITVQSRVRSSSAAAGTAAARSGAAARLEFVAHRMLGDVGACTLCLHLLRGHGSLYADVADQGLAALSNLAMDMQNREIIGAAGGCELVLEMIATHALETRSQPGKRIEDPSGDTETDVYVSSHKSTPIAMEAVVDRFDCSISGPDFGIFETEEESDEEAESCLHELNEYRAVNSSARIGERIHAAAAVRGVSPLKRNSTPEQSKTSISPAADQPAANKDQGGKASLAGTLNPCRDPLRVSVAVNGLLAIGALVRIHRSSIRGGEIGEDSIRKSGGDGFAAAATSATAVATAAAVENSNRLCKAGAIAMLCRLLAIYGLDHVGAATLGAEAVSALLRARIEQCTRTVYTIVPSHGASESESASKADTSTVQNAEEVALRDNEWVGELTESEVEAEALREGERKRIKGIRTEMDTKICGRVAGIYSEERVAEQFHLQNICPLLIDILLRLGDTSPTLTEAIFRAIDRLSIASQRNRVTFLARLRACNLLCEFAEMHGDNNITLVEAALLAFVTLTENLPRTLSQLSAVNKLKIFKSQPSPPVDSDAIINNNKHNNNININDGCGSGGRRNTVSTIVQQTFAQRTNVLAPLILRRRSDSENNNNSSSLDLSDPRQFLIGREAKERYFHMIFRAIHTHGPDSVIVAEAGLNAFLNLTTDGEELLELLGQRAECRLVLRMLHMHGSSSVGIAVHFVRVVNVLTKIESNVPILLQAGLHDILLQMIEAHALTIPLIVEESLLGLLVHFNRLTLSEANKGDPVACRLLTRVLLLYSRNKQEKPGDAPLILTSTTDTIAKHATVSVPSIRSDNSTPSAVVDSEMARRIVILVLTIVMKLSVYPPNAAHFGQRGMCGILVDVMHFYSFQDLSLAETTLVSFSNLCAQPANEAAFSREGGCDTVMDLLHAHGLKSVIVAEHGLRSLSLLAAMQGSFAASNVEESKGGRMIRNDVQLGELGACEMVKTLLESFVLDNEATLLRSLRAMIVQQRDSEESPLRNTTKERENSGFSGAVEAYVPNESMVSTLSLSMPLSMSMSMSLSMSHAEEEVKPSVVLNRSKIDAIRSRAGYHHIDRLPMITPSINGSADFPASEEDLGGLEVGFRSIYSSASGVSGESGVVQRGSSGMSLHSISVDSGAAAGAVHTRYRRDYNKERMQWPHNAGGSFYSADMEDEGSLSATHHAIRGSRQPPHFPQEDGRSQGRERVSHSSSMQRIASSAPSAISSSSLRVRSVGRQGGVRGGICVEEEEEELVEREVARLRQEMLIQCCVAIFNLCSRCAGNKELFRGAQMHRTLQTLLGHRSLSQNARTEIKDAIKAIRH